jgi:hypothetical protein
MELAVIVSIVAGAVGIPAINFLKARLGWSGDRVKFLAAVVSGVLAVGLLFAACAVSIAGLACPLPLSWDSAVAAVGVAFTVGQLIYAVLPKS